MLGAGCPALRQLLARAEQPDSRVLMERELLPAGTRPIQRMVALGDSADGDTCTRVFQHTAAGLKRAHRKGPMT
jgi:hypothetical protein